MAPVEEVGIMRASGVVDIATAQKNSRKNDRRCKRAFKILQFYLTLLHFLIVYDTLIFNAIAQFHQCGHWTG